MLALMIGAAAAVVGQGGALSQSAASPMALEQARELAQFATIETQLALPPAASTVLVAPVGRFTAKSEFNSELTAALRRAGYAIASDKTASPEAHRVAYSVRPAWSGYIVVLQVDQIETSQLFLPGSDGSLAPAGPRAKRAVQ